MSVAPLVVPDPSAQRDRADSMSSSRVALVAIAVLLVIFVLGTLAGFVYAHEPSAPELRTRLVPAASTPDSLLRGTLSSIGPDFIEVSTAAGPQRLRFASGTPVEELAPLNGAIPEGAPVNVGGHRTESGFVITGVVVLPGGAP